ncbi:hypothetical protein SUGI_1191910 [Cryptomeria japonica]|nr:hypothetical protein SUGI_1191910 [Cryptomeria japonica]
MKLLMWNVRGLNAPKKRHLIEYSIKNLQPNILLIQETKLNKDEMEGFKKSLGPWEYKVVQADGAIGGLAFLWNAKKMDMELIAKRNNWMEGFVRSINNGVGFRVINVYGLI